jgi:PBP1b-binding outer membrane lipoprotein LpoB
MKWYRLLALSLAALLLVGCDGATDPQVPTPIRVTESSDQQPILTSTPAIPSECQPNRSLLDSLAASLPYEQVVLAHQAYGNENTLFIWLVSPTINLASAEQNQEAAQLQAIQAAKNLLDASACLLEFDTLQMILVDDQYNQWFSGSLRTGDLPGLQPEQSGGGALAEQGGGWQALPAENLPPQDANACSWPQVAARLQTEFSIAGSEAVFYYVRDAGGNNVYAQWAVADQQAALNVLDQVSQIAGQVECLYPPASGISVLLTLPEGQTLLTGYLPILAGQAIDPANFSFNFIEQP